MITLGMTAGNDNTLVLVVQIELDSSTLRYATRTLTLDNTWSGGKIALNSLASLAQSVDVTDGGGVMDLNTLNFDTTKHVLHIADVFPSTSQPYLTGRRVSLGVVWTSATADSDITWLFEGYVASYLATASVMRLQIFEYSDIENVNLPYYKLQKTLDNGISYAPNVEESALGVEIPITYGAFTADTLEGYTTVVLAQAVLVDNTLLKYKCASHPVYETYPSGETGIADTIYIYDSGLDNFLETTPNNGDTINAQAGYSKQLFVTGKADGDFADATTVIFFDSPGKASEASAIGNVYDFAAGTYYTLADNKQISVKSNKSIGNNYTFGSDATDVQFNVTWSSVGAASIALSYYNPATDSYSSAYTDTNTGGTTVSTFDAGAGAFTPQDIFNYEWVIKNTTGGATTINILDAQLVVNDIIIYQFPKRKKVVKVVIENQKINYKMNLQIKTGKT